MRSEASAVRAADKQLVRVQSLLVDSLAPLATVVEAHNKGNFLDQKEVLQVARTAIKLVGNPNPHLSHLQGEKGS